MDDVLKGLLESEESTFDQENKILEPLLPEIDLIEDQGIHSLVRSALSKAPKHFWSGPNLVVYGAVTPDEKEWKGIVLHTKRMTRIITIIAEAQQIDEYERDVMLAAGLLHGITKGVQAPDNSLRYDPMYPYTLDKFMQWVRKEDEKYANEMSSSSLWVEDEVLEDIVRHVRCHLGSFSPIPETVPITGNEWTIHVADLLVSKLHVITDAQTEEWRWVITSEEK